MNSNKLRQLLVNHFLGYAEMLPDATIDHLIAGGKAEEVKVSGSSQIELQSAILIIQAALNCIKFAHDFYKDHRDRATQTAELQRRIEKDYPQLVEVLGPKGLDAFLSDIRSN